MKSDDLGKVINAAIAIGLLWLCSIASQVYSDLRSNETLVKFRQLSDSAQKIQGKLNESWIFKTDGRGR